MYQPKEHEATFSVKPIGVKRICEHCGEGEMVRDHKSQIMLMSNPPLIAHVCTKCGGKLNLPKVYPYIEWVPEEESECSSKKD